MADPTSTRAPFPQDPKFFDDDERIAYDKVGQKHILEDEDGEEWEWVPSERKWVSSISADDALMEQQQLIDEIEGGNQAPPAADVKKKRKAQELERTAEQKENDRKAQEEVQKPAPNTAVFCSGLPLDVDTRELKEIFSKYGVIAESVESNKPRIKMYYDVDDKFTGEALIVYFKPQSVSIAITMADERDIRTGAPGPTRVQEASLNKKAHTGSKAAPKPRPKAPGKRTKGGPSLAIKKMNDLESRLADWDDDDPSALPTVARNAGKVVVIAKAFKLKELAEAEDLQAEREEIQELFHEEAEKFGEVVDVITWDKEREGIVTVQFRDASHAEECAANFKGRAFDGRRLNAWVQDGQERFERTLPPKPKKQKVQEDDSEDEQARLEVFSKDIEGKATDEGAQPTAKVTNAESNKV